MASVTGNSLVELLFSGNFQFVDLGQPLNEDTLLLELPPPFANTPGFSREVVSKYDDKGPAWFWNVFTCGEHVGSHFDAPTHWVTGKDGLSVDQIPAENFVAEAIVIDLTEECKKNADRLLQVADILEFEKKYGKIPAHSYVLMRTGWGKFAQDAGKFFNVGSDGMPHTPGPSTEAVEFLAKERDILGFGTETVGTDAGIAATFTPPFPCHNIMQGSGKYGMTQLNNLDKLPPRGAVLVVLPLKMTGGSGSPVRPIAIVPK
jgi:kynurenine formamidase